MASTASCWRRTARAAADAEITIEEIRARAYDLWERNHRSVGREIELWLLAERELKAEQQIRRAGATREGADAASGSTRN